MVDLYKEHISISKYSNHSFNIKCKHHEQLVYPVSNYMYDYNIFSLTLELHIGFSICVVSTDLLVYQFIRVDEN